jgi:hypothetical protein
MFTSEAQSQTGQKVLYGAADLDRLEAEMVQVEESLPHHINADPEGVEKGLAKLVLTVIELLRRLMERQALRRVEGGSLSDAEIERLGETFLKLEQRMQELKVAFGLENEELNLNLGPLGDLM